jgi:hypothetical protein
MCKAHLHPFAVIISPFHAMGVKITPQKKKMFSPQMRHPHPLGTQTGRLRHSGKNTEHNPLASQNIPLVISHW